MHPPPQAATHCAAFWAKLCVTAKALPATIIEAAARATNLSRVGVLKKVLNIHL
jgi:hypothetical protein